MKTQEEAMVIQIMYQQGYSKKHIARELGISINTVRKYIGGNKPHYSARPLAPLKLDPFRDYIKKRLRDAHPHWVPASVIFREMKQQGYTGGESILRAYMRQLKPLAIEQPVQRFETQPGKQMQIDWAELRRGTHRLAAFIATLGYSRMSYVEFVNDERLATLLQCHENAFHYFGGITEDILYDNMKTVIVERNAYGPGKHRLQSAFWDFSKHHGFIPRVCHPYRAQTKGKVERFIHFFKHSFYYPLLGQLKASHTLLDKDTANYYVRRWLDTVANCRIHATTKAVPFTRLHEEHAHLQPIMLPYTGKINVSSSTVTLQPYSHESDTTALLQHDPAIYDQLLLEGTL